MTDNAETPKQRPLKPQRCCQKNILQGQNKRHPKDENSSVILYVLLHHYHVSMATMCLVMETGPWIWTFPHTHLFIVLTHYFTFSPPLSFSHTETPFTLLCVSLPPPSLSICLTHTQTLSLFLYLLVSLSVSLSLQKVSESAGFKAH